MVDFDDKHRAQVRQIYNKFNANNTYDSESGARSFIAQSPPSLNSQTRTHDIDAIIDIIGSATTHVNVQAMDYQPALIYSDPQVYWPLLENALRDAAFRGV